MNPKWRRKLRELVGAELAKFIPIWVKLEPPDIPQDFLIELEFYEWWREVKEFAQRGEIHPTLYSDPKLLPGGGVDMAGAGLPRKLSRCYQLGADYMIDHLKPTWPTFLLFGGVVQVTLGDSVVFKPIPCGFSLITPIKKEKYSPGDRPYQMIDQNPKVFTDSLNFWWGHYQVYLKLTPTERRFLIALGSTARWEPKRLLPGVDPKNHGRHLTRMEALGLIAVDRRSNGTIFGIHLTPKSPPVRRICKVLLS